MLRFKQILRDLQTSVLLWWSILQNFSNFYNFSFVAKFIFPWYKVSLIYWALLDPGVCEGKQCKLCESCSLCQHNNNEQHASVTWTWRKMGLKAKKQRNDRFHEGFILWWVTKMLSQLLFNCSHRSSQWTLQILIVRSNSADFWWAINLIFSGCSAEVRSVTSSLSRLSTSSVTSLDKEASLSVRLGHWRSTDARITGNLTIYSIHK